MTYVRGNPKTKKELKEMVAKGPVAIFNPGLGTIPQEGTVWLEGPQYPKAHVWSAEGRTKDGMLVWVK